MGFRDIWDSTVNGVKTPVTYACQSSYSLGSAAVSKIDNAFRGGNGVDKLKQYLPGPEGQEKIGRALTVVTHPATKELLKLVAPPGGAQAYNIMAAILTNPPRTSSHSCFYDNMKYKQAMEELKVLRVENGKMRADLERITNELELSDKLNSITPPSRFKSLSTVEQKPEEVISVFMMNGFKVRDFKYDQVVPPIGGVMERE